MSPSTLHSFFTGLYRCRSVRKSTSPPGFLPPHKYTYSALPSTPDTPTASIRGGPSHAGSAFHANSFPPAFRLLRSNAKNALLPLPPPSTPVPPITYTICFTTAADDQAKARGNFGNSTRSTFRFSPFHRSRKHVSTTLSTVAPPTHNNPSANETLAPHPIPSGNSYPASTHAYSGA